MTQIFLYRGIIKPYFPPPHAYTVPFSQRDICVSPKTPACMPPLVAPPMGAPPMCPPPMADETVPFNFTFISGNISKCAGCGNKYVKQAVPTYDLCIQHREFTPAYYHVNTACIRRNWPSFPPEQISVMSGVCLRLNPAHREYLFHHGFTTC